MRRALVEPKHAALSVARQCGLLGMAWSSWYYTLAGESAENLELMGRMDEQYARTSVSGIRRMTAWLRQQGYPVTHKRVGRLLRLMGLAALYPQPRLSAPGVDTKRYPYLLRGLTMARSDQVWSTDITYIRMQQGFLYLVAILDWYSRSVLAWDLSTTLDTSFYLAAVETALQQGQAAGPADDLHHRPGREGVQVTSAAYTSRLEQAGIQIRWDGRGRALDTGFVERLGRSVTWEAAYLKDYQTVAEAAGGLDRSFRFYNQERPHQALGYQTPAQVYGMAS